MAFLNSVNIVASGLTAQQLRLDIVAENVTNSQTTRTEGGGAYRRKMVVFEAMDGRNDFRAALARAVGARYVVFHVSNVTVDECLSDRMEHTDEEVCAAAAELINRLNEGRDDPFDFLVENLWWPGLTLTRPAPYGKAHPPLWK